MRSPLPRPFFFPTRAAPAALAAVDVPSTGPPPSSHDVDHAQCEFVAVPCSMLTTTTTLPACLPRRSSNPSVRTKTGGRDESEVIMLQACKTGVTDMVEQLMRARTPVDCVDEIWRFVGPIFGVAAPQCPYDAFLNVWLWRMQGTRKQQNLTFSLIYYVMTCGLE